MGVVLSNVLYLSNTVRWGVRQSAELETLLTAAERVLEYAGLPSEAPLRGGSSRAASEGGWPNDGVVKFSNVRARYELFHIA